MLGTEERRCEMKYNLALDAIPTFSVLMVTHFYVRRVPHMCGGFLGGDIFLGVE
jgi:hypothetical protein